MFEFEVPTDPFHTLVDVLGSCVEESRMTAVPAGLESPPAGLDEGGIHVEDAGPDTIIFTNMRMPSGFFDTIEIDELLQVGMDWQRVAEVIGEVESSSVRISYDPDDYYLYFDDDEGFHYTMSPIDPETMAERDVPGFAFDHTYTVDAGRLKNGIDKVGLVSDSVHFVIEDGDVVVWARGDSDEVSWDMVDDVDAPDMSTEVGRSVLRSFTDYMNSDLDVELRLNWELDTDRGSETADEYNLPMGFAATFGGYVETEFYVAPRRTSGT